MEGIVIRLIAAVAAIVFGICAVICAVWMRHPTPFEGFTVFALSAIAIEACLAATRN